MRNILTIEEFRNLKRENLLDYKYYEAEFFFYKEGDDILKEILNLPKEKLKKIPLYNSAVAAQERAWDALNQLTLAYSAGHEISELREFTRRS